MSATLLHAEIDADMNNPPLQGADMRMEMPMPIEWEYNADVPAVNVGNKICPVSGDLIKEDTKVTVEYRGKIVNLCSQACVAKFNENAIEYTMKAEDQMEAEALEAVTGGAPALEPDNVKVSE
jgi:YHS domain-containing protein